jgi:hydroxymethylpyrimidine pyrophosphatase-like HAD family hydrolase
LAAAGRGAGVVENGGATWVRDGDGVRLEFADGQAVRLARAPRLRACLDAVRREVPGADAARDSGGRHTDIAVDHAEFAPLDAAQVDAVVAVMRRHGLHVSVSSIHVNGWLGGHDKWTGACRAVERVLGIPLDPACWVDVGDSANDEVVFARVPLSVGVANIARWWPRLASPPAFVTRGGRGAGFAEVARALLAQRASC